MKELEWRFTGEWVDKLSEDFITEVLEVSEPKKNCWWSNMKAFADGNTSWKQRFHDVINNIRQGREDSFAETFTTAKLCPAIREGILNKVVLIKMPNDLIISKDETGRFGHTGCSGFVDVGAHSPKQWHTEKDNPFENKFNMKFQFPIYTRTEKELPWMFLHPQYHKQDLPFEVLNGVIEGKNTKGQFLALNTMAEIPKEQETIMIKKGTVIAYMWLPEKVKLKYNPKMKIKHQTTFSGLQHSFYYPQDDK